MNQIALNMSESNTKEPSHPRRKRRAISHAARKTRQKKKKKQAKKQSSIVFFTNFTFQQVDDALGAASVFPIHTNLINIIYGYAEWRCKVCQSSERGLVTRCPCERDACTCKEDKCEKCYFHEPRVMEYKEYYDLCNCDACTNSMRDPIGLRMRNDVLRCTINGCTREARLGLLNELPKRCIAHRIEKDFLPIWYQRCGKALCPLQAVFDCSHAYKHSVDLCYLHY